MLVNYYPTRHYRGKSQKHQIARVYSKLWRSYFVLKLATGAALFVKIGGGVQFSAPNYFELLKIIKKRGFFKNGIH